MRGLTVGTWVLVADGRKALLLKYGQHGDHAHLVLHCKEEGKVNPANQDHVTDRAGRMSAPAGSAQRTAMREADHHQMAEDKFAVDLVEMLQRELPKDGATKLVLVAAPDVLGVLRPALPDDLAALVVKEIAKTLTNHPLPEIEKIVIAEMDA